MSLCLKKLGFRNEKRELWKYKHTFFQIRVFFIDTYYRNRAFATNLILKILFVYNYESGAETSCVCVCNKRVCVRNTESKACTVGINSTKESQYLYSLGEYTCLLLIVYLNKYAKNTIWLKFTINYSLFKFNYNRRHCSTIS